MVNQTKTFNTHKNYIDRSHLLTEQTNELSKNLDMLTSEELVKLFCSEDIIPQQAVANAAKEISIAVDLIYKRLQFGGRLFYLGAGTSGRLAVIDAAECPPTFCSSPELVQGIIAGGYSSMINSSESLEDDYSLGVKDLKAKEFSSEDCLVGITAGGTTPYVTNALAYSKSIKALTIAVACVPSEQANLISDIDIRLITGPELLTGSTRLKAGTATKMLLNILSTSVMIKLGKVYGNSMVDVSASNKKLIDRSIRILNRLLGVDKNKCMKLLEASDGSVKLALLLGSSNMSVNSAKRHLEKHGNHLRPALESIGESLVD